MPLSGPHATRETRIGWLDALRGWAILGVVLVHTGQGIAGLPGFWGGVAAAGQYGVQLFFIVSALTIGLTYERQVQGGSGIARASIAWLVKRLMRIAPLYYYGIGLYLVVFAGMRILGSAQPIAGPGDILANLLFLHGWIPSAQNTVVPGGWSIAVEMTFYLVAPGIFLLIRSVRASLAALAVSAFGVVALDHAASGGGIANNSFLYFWFPTQLPVFMAGIALYRIAGARLWTGLALAPKDAILIALGTAGLAVCGLVFGTGGDVDHALAPSLMGLAFCGLVLLSAASPLRIVAANPAAEWLGRISYSVYINHFAAVLLIRCVAKRLHLWDGMSPPVALGLACAAALLLALPASVVTRRLIEAPGIALGRRLSAAIEAGHTVPAAVLRQRR
jgi:peptidoglycan/LPS O-acetylase OafA/YrhL